MKDENFRSLNLLLWRRLQDVSINSISSKMLAGELLFETYKCIGKSLHRNCRMQKFLPLLYQNVIPPPTLSRQFLKLSDNSKETFTVESLIVQLQLVDWTACITQKKPYWDVFLVNLSETFKKAHFPYMSCKMHQAICFRSA